jgi:mono/diheme cytochrome c family protein
MMANRLRSWRSPACVAAAGVALMWLVVRPATAQEVDQGRRVFTQNCAMCHGDEAEGMAGMHPSLRGAVDRLTLEGVEVTVRNGRDTTPPMPAFEDRLSDSEIADVIAYIDSLPRGTGEPDGPMGDDGMGGMMNEMGDDNDTVLWIVIVVLAALACALGGYVLGRRPR